MMGFARVGRRGARFTSPYILLLLSIVGNLILQICNQDSDWSPFRLLGTDYNPKVTFYAAIAVLALTAGYSIARFKHFCLPRMQKQRDVPINLRRLQGISKVIFLLQIALTAATQIALGSANIVNLWSGAATPQDVEAALKNSPFGINGLAIIVSYLAIMVWHTSRLLHFNCRWTIPLLVAACIHLLSQGKAQGVIYVAAAYLCEPREIRSALLNILAIVLMVGFIFLVTRIARNSESDMIAGVELFLQLALGLYFGSPVANTSYALAHGLDVNNISAFLPHLVPQKLLPDNSNFTSQLPDPTSPFGMVGYALFLGNPVLFVLYFILCGYFSQDIRNRSSYELSSRIFLPFLLVSCAFAMMYNHFANTVFFWIPFFMAKVLARAITLRRPSSGRTHT